MAAGKWSKIKEYARKGARGLGTMAGWASTVLKGIPNPKAQAAGNIIDPLSKLLKNI